MSTKVPIEEEYMSKLAEVTSSFPTASATLEFELYSTLSNLGFYLFLIPYKIVYDNRRRMFKVAVYRLQQVPCIIFQALTIFYVCNVLRRPELGNLKENPKQIFEYFISLSYVITSTVLYGTGWFRRHTTVALINRLQLLGNDEQELPMATKAKRETVRLEWLPALSTKTKARACIWLMAVPGMIYYCAINNMFNLSFISIYKSMAGQARFTFGLQPDTNVPAPAELWSVGTKILTPFYIFSDLHRYATTSMIDEILIISAFIGLRLAKRFVDNIQQETSAAVVMKRYQSLKSTFQRFNEALGGCFFALLFGVIPYYSSGLAESLEMKDVVSNLLFLLFFMYYGVALVMASEANRRAGYIKKWLCDHEENIDLSKQSLQILISDLNWSQIGLQGPGGILTITYGLLGTLMSLILTYSVIMVQLQSTKAYTTN